MKIKTEDNVENIELSKMKKNEGNDTNIDISKKDEADPYKKLLHFEKQDISVFKLYFSLSERTDIILMIFATLGSLGAGVSMPMFSILFGRTFSGYGPKSNSAASFSSTIDVMVRNYLIVGACMCLAYFLMSGFWNLVGRRQILRLKELYFRAIMRQEQGWFDSNNAFEFCTKVQAQIKQIEGGMGEKMGTVLMMISQVFTGLIIAFSTSWKLSLVILSTSPLITISLMFMGKSMRDGITEARKSYEIAGGIAEEVLYNIKTVASFANFDFEINRFNDFIEKCKTVGIKNGFGLGLGMGCVWLFMFSTYCIAIIYGSILIINQDWNTNANRIFEAGDVMTCIFSTVMAVSSLGAMAPIGKAIGEACVAASDYFYLEKRQPQSDTSKSNKKHEKDTIKGKIEFKNVSFCYPTKPDLKILNQINLTFEEGSKIAIVGESGSGKSTIVNLIERLYDSNEGTITIDDIDIREFDIDYLRSLIGYVQQEPVLFNKSIKENIIFGRDLSVYNNAENMILEACEDSYSKEFINTLNGKYECIVGIKGNLLSGGQKQRIAIARAILTKPKILLLDEATSALDNKSEKEVQKALDLISNKKVTTIIIAHRLSTIKNADKIIAIKKGEVVEFGTHKELLEKNGYYAGLIKSQIMEEELGLKKEIIEDDSPLESEIKPNEELVGLNSKNLNKTETDEKSNTNIQAVTPEIDRKKLFSFLSDNKCNLGLAVMGSAANGCVFPIYGFVLSTAINVLSDPNFDKVKSGGLFMGMMFLIIAFCVSFATFLQNYKFTTIGEVLSSKLRNAIFIKYLRLHLGYFDKTENSPGSLLTKLSIDTTLLNGLVLTVVGVSVQSLVCLSLGLIIGFYYEWRLAFICIAFFPFIIISAAMQQKLRKGGSSGDDRKDIEAGSILSECVINTKTIFSYNFTEKAIEMYKEILSESKDNIVSQCLIQGFLFGIGQFALFAAYATLFYAGGRFIINGSLNFNDMTRAIMSILFSAFGLGMAQQFAGDYVKASNAFISIFGTLDLQTEIDTSDEANNHKNSGKELTGKIEFRDVSFCYPTRPDSVVIKKMNFTILPGQSVAFVGYSGSGKSTIIQLIERFYDVSEGQILIDDKDIREYNLLELRRKIGIVSQEPCLFKRSVYDNILYGDLNASKEQILDAAKKANIMKFFSNDDIGTKDTPVSGGEKQRLAIARVFLKNPQIILLDEATSALDNESEKEVQSSLNSLQGGRTSITIAHRLSTIENCDVIYVLENGKVVEKGSHKELYDLKGKYYSLHKYSNNL